MPDPSSLNRTGRSALAILLVPLAVGLVLTLFAWPAARLEPRELPVGVAGPPAATEPVERRLAAGDGSFDIHRYPDGPGARRAIEQREVYGAFVTGTDTQVLTATAAGATVAGLLEQAAGGDRSGGAAAVDVQDVVPASEDDPRGAAMPAAVLPLVLAGVLTGVAATLLAPLKRRRAGLVLASSVLVGLAATAIVQGWLGRSRGRLDGELGRVEPHRPGHRFARDGTCGAAWSAQSGAGGHDDGGDRQRVVRCFLGSGAAAPANRRDRAAAAPGGRLQPAAQHRLLRRRRRRRARGRTRDLGTPGPGRPDRRGGARPAQRPGPSATAGEPGSGLAPDCNRMRRGR
jgi:hypothetical protein